MVDERGLAERAVALSRRVTHVVTELGTTAKGVGVDLVGLREASEKWCLLAKIVRCLIRFERRLTMPVGYAKVLEARGVSGNS